MHVGAAEVDITPPLDVPYLGFHPRQAQFERVHDALHARAAVFDDSGTRVCLVSMDAIGMDNRMLGPGRDFTRELRTRVSEHCVVPPAHTMVSCTHAHSTPETLGITRAWELPAMGSWIEELLERLTAAAGLAASSLEPCSLAWARGSVVGVAHNRRPFAKGVSVEEQVERGLVDPQLQLLVAKDEQGDARCGILGFQCHPVTMQVQPLVSADYPGVACAMVQHTLPGRPVCLFLQGAAGNLNPVGDDSRDFRDVELLGAAVGAEALRLAVPLMANRSTGTRVGTVRAMSRKVRIPPRELPARESVEAENQAARARLDSAASEGERSEAKRALQRAREAADLLERYAQAQETEVQALRIGEVAVAGCSGELFTEWGLRIKRESPAAQTFVAELANGWIGYLLNRGGFAEGGYESAPGTWTQTSEEGSSIVVDALIECARALW